MNSYHQGTTDPFQVNNDRAAEGQSFFVPSKPYDERLGSIKLGERLPKFYKKHN